MLLIFLILKIIITNGNLSVISCSVQQNISDWSATGSVSFVTNDENLCPTPFTQLIIGCVLFDGNCELEKTFDGTGLTDIYITYDVKTGTNLHDTDEYFEAGYNCDNMATNYVFVNRLERNNIDFTISILNQTISLPIECNNNPNIKIKFVNVAQTEEIYFNNVCINIDNTQSNNPTVFPTNNPTLYPSMLTNIPSFVTNNPTNIPSVYPTSVTGVPTNIPTVNPTLIPTEIPSIYPTSVTGLPTNIPTINPTLIPTNIPSVYPTIITDLPTNIPTLYPTFTNDPTINTLTPTYIPTIIPTNIPSYIPTNIPSINPSNIPTIIPTNIPTKLPTNIPSYIPTNIPSFITTINKVNPGDNNKKEFALTISIYALLAAMGGVLVCISIVGCIGCYINGRYHEMKLLSENESQKRKMLETQLSKANTLLTSLSSLNSINSTTHTELNNDIALASEGGHNKNMTTELTGMDSTDIIINNKMINDDKKGKHENYDDDDNESLFDGDVDNVTTDGDKQTGK